MLNFENLDKAIFWGIGQYNIPPIAPLPTDFRADKLQWIPFNYAKTAKNRKSKGIHFFVDDYQFVRLWNRPDDYISLLTEFGAVCTPDFSLYTDTPKALQIYNHYRKHWLGAYWQMHGITVLPTICWSTPDSFDWCFDGEPTDSIVAVSSVGTQNKPDMMRAFERGYEETLKRLAPSQILWYGHCPEKYDWNAIKVKPHYDDIVKRRIAKNGRERFKLE